MPQRFQRPYPPEFWREAVSLVKVSGRSVREVVAPARGRRRHRHRQQRLSPAARRQPRDPGRPRPQHALSRKRRVAAAGGRGDRVIGFRETCLIARPDAVPRTAEVEAPWFASQAEP